MQDHNSMPLNIWIIFLGIMLGLLPNTLKAQTTLNTTGGSQTTTEGTFDYSIGEMTVVSTQSNADITVTQGLLQPESATMGVDKEILLDQNLTVFPNPAKNSLHIKPALNGAGELAVQLFDLHGRLILQKSFSLHTGLEKQELDLSSLQEATYMLDVQFKHGKQNYRQTYKIIKSGH